MGKPTRRGRKPLEQPAPVFAARLRPDDMTIISRAIPGDTGAFSGKARIVLETVADVLRANQTVRRLDDRSRDDLRSYLAGLGFNAAGLDFLTEVTIGIGALIENMFIQQDDGSLTLAPAYPLTDQDGDGVTDQPVTVKSTQAARKRRGRITMSASARAASAERRAGRPRKPTSIFQRTRPPASVVQRNEQ